MINFQLHRLQGFIGEGDSHLPQIIQGLKQLLRKTSKLLKYKTLQLPNKNLEELSSVLVEFAEDIHNDIGIWSSYEKYNSALFGTRLPLTQRSNEAIENNTIDKHRVHHLLWVLYSELDEDLILSPLHQDLFLLAETISGFLKNRFSEVPRDSGLKTFLAQPEKYGWDVKKKLVWLGQHSYLFRHHCNNYIRNKGGKLDIPTIDDFICQETTSWSGLGVIDVLAVILNITEKQRTILRNWYERHWAYYKVLSIKGSIIEAINLINNKPYTIRAGEFSDNFKVNQIIFAGLLPWDGEWYFSGAQHTLNKITEAEIPQLRNEFIQEASSIVYRYHNQLAERAKESMKVHYKEFVEYHGEDLIIYPDGLSMAADQQKQYRLQYESKPEEVLADHLRKHNLQNPWPRMSYPPHLLENENGIGVYYNPNEGQEVMEEFNDVVNGLKKKGNNLTEDEKEMIEDFIRSDAISPSFVRKMVEKYGDESIASAFLIKNNQDIYFLDYLLHRYKGHFYRNRYPSISFKLDDVYM